MQIFSRSEKTYNNVSICTVPNLLLNEIFFNLNTHCSQGRRHELKHYKQY